MKRKFLFLIVLSLLFCVLIPVRAQETAAKETRKFVDDFQHEVVIPSPVTSIVTLAPSLTEIAASLSAEDLIAAVDCNSDYPLSVKELPAVTGPDWSIDYERLAELKPDLVLVSEMTSPEEARAIGDLGPAVFRFKNPADFQGVFESILVFGELIGRDAEAENLTAALEDRIAEIEARMENAEDAPRVFYVIDAADPERPWTAGKGSFLSKMIRMSGGINLGDALDGEWGQMNLEDLAAADPQVILTGSSMSGSSAESLSELPGWSGLAAVRNGMVFGIDDDLLTRSGPRLVDGFELLAHTLRPDLFAGK